MQVLPPEILSQAKSEKMKKLDEKLKKLIQGSQVGERVICPVCHYSSKKNRTSAVIFEDSIKCYACGMWRRI